MDIPFSSSASSLKLVSLLSWKPSAYLQVQERKAQFRASLSVNSTRMTDNSHISPRRERVISTIQNLLPHCLSETCLDVMLPLLKCPRRGKVRDIYEFDDYLIMVTTDRLSAFDRAVACIPLKGQVLNETSLWWFDQTKHIASNAVVTSPDKNVTIARKCTPIPVEFVVRGFITGSTDTSLWTVYEKGARSYCGNVLPDGLKKNQKLEKNIITPTTKALDHDAPLTPHEIISSGLMPQPVFDEACFKALSLFEHGQHIASDRGLLLVDTKYEFGMGSDGSLLLIDEVHTPDSSRYWLADSYEERFRKGLQPENIDKEILRLWFKNHCNPYEDKVLPNAPEDLVCELAWRYILLFEMISGSQIEFPSFEVSANERITRNVADILFLLK